MEFDPSRRRILKAIPAVLTLAALANTGIVCGGSEQGVSFQTETKLNPERRLDLATDFASEALDFINKLSMYQFSAILNTYNKVTGKSLTVDDLQGFSDNEIQEISDTATGEGGLDFSTLPVLDLSDPRFLLDEKVGGLYNWTLILGTQIADKPIVVVFTGSYSEDLWKDERSVLVSFDMYWDAYWVYRSASLEQNIIRNNKSMSLRVSTLMSFQGFNPDRMPPENPPDDRELGYWFYTAYSYQRGIPDARIGLLGENRSVLLRKGKSQEIVEPSVEEMGFMLEELRKVNSKLEADSKCVPNC